jgi:hypothetical protein
VAVLTLCKCNHLQWVGVMNAVHYLVARVNGQLQEQVHIVWQFYALGCIPS